MGDHKAKEALYDALVEAARALANGRRAELVDVLAQGERSVDELAGEIQQSVANTSQHLQRLLRAGVITSRRSGTRGEITPGGAPPWSDSGGHCAKRPKRTRANWANSPGRISVTVRVWAPSPGTSCSGGSSRVTSSSST